MSITMPLRLACCVVLPLVSATFRTQDWTYNASLFWTAAARHDPRNGESVVNIAKLFTDLVFGVRDAVMFACIPEGQGGSCKEAGWCYLPQLVAHLLYHTAQCSEGLRALAPSMESALTDVNLRLADNVENLLGTVPSCAAVAELTESEELCSPSLLTMLDCVKGTSDLSRLAMSRIHAAQVASSEELRTAQPPMIFEGTRGSGVADVLASLLSEISRQWSLGTVKAAEIGVHTGQTSSFLLERLPFLQMVLVDPFEFADKSYFEQHTLYEERSDAAQAFDVFWERVRPYRNRSVIITQRSPGAASWVPDSFLHLVFIDSFHAYDEVKADIEAWLPKLQRPGILAGHDYGLFWPGVCEAVHEFAVSKNLTLILGPEGLWWFQV